MYLVVLPLYFVHKSHKSLTDWLNNSLVNIVFGHQEFLHMALLRDLLLNKFYFGVGREGCSPVTTAEKLKAYHNNTYY